MTDERHKEEPIATGNPHEETATIQPQGTAEGATHRAKKGRWVGSILRGDVLQTQRVLRQIPLILLLCIFGIALVYNRYHIEDLSRQKQGLQDEINYLRQRRIELQKRYQETVKISQIAAMLDSTGIGITAGPPYELISEE